MRSFNLLLLAQLVLALCLALLPAAEGKPIFDLFFGGLANGSRGKSRRGQGTRQSRGGGDDEYRRICKVINPDPYSMPGSIPFPAAPFCPP